MRIIVKLTFHVGAVTLPRGNGKCAGRRTDQKYHTEFPDDVPKRGGHVR